VYQHYPQRAVSFAPGILARGPWQAGQVAARWREEEFHPPPERTAAADRAIAALEDRGSPAHDGLAARLAGFDAGDDTLEMELQPMRWSLRLVSEDASCSLAVLCVVRDSDGRWLAGRRAPWVASWAGRWALGAGGAVEIGEDPTETLLRELAEEWSVEPERATVEALVCLPNRMVMLVGQAWLPAGAEVRRDHEHDAHAWWPRDVGQWPEEAAPPLRRMAKILSGDA
jgi:8-oxo-dGTP diphosphatase